MPGYRALPSRVSGPAADQVRQAELYQRAGNLQAAAELLEQTLDELTADVGAMPGWICGRLAAVYRAQRRYDDEVALLERYAETQVSEDARARFRGRLSKARAIADRQCRKETGDIQTIRQVKARAKTRRGRSGEDDSSLSIAS